MRRSARSGRRRWSSCSPRGHAGARYADRALIEARVGGPGSVGPGLLIESEAADKHLGGTVLAVLAGLGDEGAAGPSQTVAQAVAGLRKVGLADEARHLAIDAALAAGF
ncbi:MAG: hypothetical protein WDN69_25500 [Aliidongia sp.]